MKGSAHLNLSKHYRTANLLEVLFEVLGERGGSWCVEPIVAVRATGLDVDFSMLNFQLRTPKL